MVSTQKFLDVKLTTLDEWLALVFNPPPNTIFIDVAFPTDTHRQQYLQSIHMRTETEVYRLLSSFLIHSGSLITDQLKLQGLIATKDTHPDLFNAMIERSYYKRLVLSAAGKKDVAPWEGLTWIFDLLPHFPKDALAALDAYILAHAQFLPDWRYVGLEDAMQIIRAKFIGMPGTRQEAISQLLSLSPRDFEHIVERLYNALGYHTKLTPATKDGGRDVLASKNVVSQREELVVECKLYTQPISVSIVRTLLGVVSSEKVNKGVVVTTSHFTKSARDFAVQNPRIELINGDELVGLMNEHLGPSWPLHVDRLINESKRGQIPANIFPCADE